MATALYRLSSNEVLKISSKNQMFGDRDSAYYGVLVAPSLPDGATVREAFPGGTFGPFRVLGYAKIAEPGINTVRNATQGEIDGFAGAEAADEAALDATEAQRLLQTDPTFRKAMKALVKRIVAENNNQSTEWNALRAEIAAATSFADMKTRIAASTADLPIRTLPQALTALVNDVSASD